MAEDRSLRIGHDLSIPADEIVETASRSSGPGGQHVNKTETRVTLRWNVRESRVLSDALRQRLEARLGRRLTRLGHLVVHAQQFRSRARNRELARERMAELIRDALRTRRRRIATAPSQGQRRRRLEDKRRRARTKQQRARPGSEDA